ncbi:MAG: hypothetical protein II815_04155 [Bacteroidales bacterium]|nr:hypothetical protein [Bacteroidales bacterium]MBR0415354.1 hypothetical protein [Clostridia bacterium]
MLRKIKTIASVTIGVPAALIVCSEANGMDGFALQLGALAVLLAVLALNGVFKREGAYDK